MRLGNGCRGSGGIEVFPVTILEPRFEAGLRREPHEECLQGIEGGVEGGLAQRLTRANASLLLQVLLEPEHLLTVEPLEIGKLGVALEAVDCRRELVNRNVSKPQLVPQVVDIKAL